MDQLAPCDLYVLAALSTSLLTTLVVAILFLMRNPAAMPPRMVSRSPEDGTSET